VGFSPSNHTKEIALKKIAFLFCAAACASGAATAGDINTLYRLSQDEFRIMSEDMGAALSYKSVMPTESLGILGFDVGLVVSSTDVSRSSAILYNASNNGGLDINTLFVPKLMVAKGFPFGVDVAGFYSALPTTNIRLMGAEVRYALVEGDTFVPAVAVRGAFSKLSGVEQWSMDTKSLDISASKGFAMLTPYAGVGMVWVNSSPQASTGLKAESFSKLKYFAGVNFNLGLFNLALETDKTGSTSTFSFKGGFRF
jgi:hypothetical protein